MKSSLMCEARQLQIDIGINTQFVKK